MSIESEMLTALKNHAGTAALVAARIYGTHFPQGATFPLVTFTLISKPRLQAVDGTILSRSPWFQVDAWDDDYAGVIALSAQLEACLIALAGSTVTFGDREILNESDIYDPETKLYHRPIDVRFNTWT